jgi:heme/copper-type cytochrome/quinol oxidase subunit 3
MTTMAHVAVMEPPAAAEQGAGVYNEKLGMWIFLGSEVMFFTALIGSYIILRFGAQGPWAAPGVVLNVPVTAFNTFLLICSSVSMVKAYAAVVDGDQAKFKMWLLLTIIAGASFVGVQGYEYTHLIQDGFLPSGIREGSELAEKVAAGAVPEATAGIYGSSFYIMTGFHGFHVTCGVVSMIWVYLKALRGGYSSSDYRGVEVIGLYWHFVDLVWIILFTIVYLV